MTTYFHGTVVDLTEVVPSHNPLHAASEPGWAYATTNELAAQHYAHAAASQAGGRERVYEVEATGPVEPDPNNYFPGMDVRSRSPFRVLREVARKTAAFLNSPSAIPSTKYGKEYVARGLSLSEVPEAVGKKIVAGTVTAADIIKAAEPLGIWWWTMGDGTTIEDPMTYAEGMGDQNYTLKGQYEEDPDDTWWEYSEVNVVIVAKRPMRNGNEPWDPEKHNPDYGLMGNSHLEPGEHLEVVEVMYDAGWGWKALPAQGIRTTAGAKGDLPEGMTIEVDHNAVCYGDTNQPAVRFTAHVPGDPRPIGSITISGDRRIASNDDQTPGVISYAQTRWDYQRRGVATALLEYARKRYPSLVHSPVLTDDGRAWRQTVAGKEGDLPQGLTVKEFTGDTLPDPFRDRPKSDFERVVLAYVGGYPIGLLTWWTPEWSSEITWVEVWGHYKRRGVANAMLEYAKTLDPQIKHSPVLTDEGRAWSQAVANKTAGPAGGRIPKGVKARPPFGSDRYKPRPVVLDRQARQDIDDLEPDERSMVLAALKRLERGTDTTLEAKSRPPLTDTFTLDVTGAMRACFYLHTDGSWHVYAILPDHDYGEAERRMWAAATLTKDCTCCNATGEHDNGSECYACDASGTYDGGPIPCIGLTSTAAVGFTIDPKVYVSEEDDDDGEVERVHFVRAVDSSGNGIGSLQWNDYDEIVLVQVDDKWRRKGVATALLQYAREKNGRIYHSTTLSDDGRAWSEKVAAKTPPGLVLESVKSSMRPQDGIVVASIDGKRVGTLRWYDTGEIASVVVHDEWRRQGIASAMLVKAREVDPRVRHSQTLSDDGRAWSQKAASTYTVQVNWGSRTPDDPKRAFAPDTHQRVVTVEADSDWEARMLAAQMVNSGGTNPVTSLLPDGMVTDTKILSMEAKTASLPDDVTITWDSGRQSITARTETKMVGYLTWRFVTDEIGTIWVHRDYRRQGLATKMLEMARTENPTLKHTTVPGQLSNDGAAWAQTVGSKTASLPSGYTIEVEEREEPDHPSGRSHLLWVRALSEGRVIGELSVSRAPDRYAGDDSPAARNGRAFSVNAIWIKPEHRRKGLATAMYAEVHRRYPGVPVMHSFGQGQSADARALNKTLKERFGPQMHLGKTAAVGVGVPLRNIRKVKDMGGGTDVFEAEVAPGAPLVYRNIGKRIEMEDAVEFGAWQSKGGFTVISHEGDTQFTTNRNEALAWSHSLRQEDNGYWYLVTADITGETVRFAGKSSDHTQQVRPYDGVSHFVNYGDGTGVYYPDQGLGIGVVGEMDPNKVIKRVETFRQKPDGTIPTNKDMTWSEAKVWIQERMEFARTPWGRAATLSSQSDQPPRDVMSR